MFKRIIQKTINLAGLEVHRARNGQEVMPPPPLQTSPDYSGGFNHIDQGTQILLRLKYQELLRSKAPLPSFDEVEFRSCSQNGEDGILLYLFSLIGTTNKKVVEIGVGSGMECNSANLIINHGWRGLLLDGDPQGIENGKNFYGKHRDTWVFPPTLVKAWISPANVNELITEHGFAGEIDLLSIDIDGNDFWVWKAIDCARPRVVVLEHNSLGGAERSVTIPYREDFVADLTEGPPYYLGATLPAFVKLCRQKGYRLVGGQRLWFNAFFVRDGVGEDVLPEVSAAECLRGISVTDAGLKILAEREFVEI